MTLGWIVAGVAGLGCMALAVWNAHLSADNCDLHESVHQLSEDNKVYEAKIERLLDDVTKLAAQVPKHGTNGRFVKRG